MPTAARRRCAGCKQLVDGRCPTCQTSWTRKPKSWRHGSTRAWRTFRTHWLDEHPLCMETDCDQLATVVCHIEGTDYTTDRLNPEAIEGQRCAACDAMRTSQYGNRSQRAQAPTPPR